MLISNLRQFHKKNAYIKLFLSNQSSLVHNSCPRSNVNKVTKTSSYSSIKKFSTTSPVLLGVNSKKQAGPNDGARFVKILGVFASGALAYLLYSTSQATPKKAKNEKKDTTDPVDIMDEKFSIDLNEVYEKCAVRFLSSTKLQNALGIPIKITSHEADDIRQLYLRRQGPNLFAFVSYRLIGSHNTGHVYAKLKMNGETKAFSTNDIVLKLDKPFEGQKEIVIKSEKDKKESK